MHKIFVAFWHNSYAMFFGVKIIRSFFWRTTTGDLRTATAANFVPKCLVKLVLWNRQLFCAFKRFARKKRARSCWWNWQLDITKIDRFTICDGDRFIGFEFILQYFGEPPPSLQCDICWHRPVFFHPRVSRILWTAPKPNEEEKSIRFFFLFHFFIPWRRESV